MFSSWALSIDHMEKGWQHLRRASLELLENRRLLNGSAMIHLSGAAGSSAALVGTATPMGYSPQQIRAAYGIDSITYGSLMGDGAGQTIAIVAVYDNPKLVSSTDASFLQSDLHLFDVRFAIPDPPSFVKLDQNGGTRYPGADPARSTDNSWAAEAAMDVEWAHAIAPRSNIVLIEAATPTASDVATAINTARNLAGVSVVSFSGGWTEDQTMGTSEKSMDALFTTPAGHQGVTFVASSGDNGPPGSYPAFSPNVLAAGGTRLVTGGHNASETAWSNSGGGQSLYEVEPGYQRTVQNSGWRQIPDVAFNADPGTGVAVYDSYDLGASTPWTVLGGTSLAAPCWAGLIAIANQIRVSQKLGTLDGPSQTLPGIYQLPIADYRDITDGGNNVFSASVGYDLVTGLGRPVASLLVPDLALLKKGSPPTVTSSIPSLIGGRMSAGVTDLTVNFNEPILGGDKAANFELRSEGLDGILGTDDDNIIALSLPYSPTPLALPSSLLQFSPLPEGVYRLTVRDAITDIRGWRLDGNSDGEPGGDWITDFVVVSTALFSAVTNIPDGGTGFEGATGVAAGDLNGDGKSDIVVVNTDGYNYRPRVLLADGFGGFGPPISLPWLGEEVLTADFNNDGATDIALSGGGSRMEVTIFVNDGIGGFAPPSTYWTGGYVLGGEGAYDLTTGDFNGDGNADLVTVNGGYYGKLSVLLGDGTGAFGTPTVYSTNSMPKNVAAGDFNGDGNLDLAVDGPNVIFLGNGDGSFEQKGLTRNFSSSTSEGDLVGGDFNRDGRTDLAMLGDSGVVCIYLAASDGGFGLYTPYGDGGYRSDRLALADFNADGKLDLAATFGGNGSIAVFLGDGNGSFASADEYRTNVGAICLAVGDFNGDGKPDLAETPAFANYNGTVGVLLNVYKPPPVTLISPHGVPFDIVRETCGAGQIIQGQSNAFDGYGRLIIDGDLFRPNTSSSASDDGQSVATGSATHSGLIVSRKITVPDTGGEDFARTVDSFANLTGAPITVNVKIVGNLGSDAATKVFTTSDTDQVVEATDQWIGTDDADGTGTPAIIHYIHGAGSRQPDYVSIIGDNIEWCYTLTVAAGRTERLTYFTILDTTRAGALAAARRLVTPLGLRPDAAAFLSKSELQSLANFPGNINATPGGEIAVFEGSTNIVSGLNTVIDFGRAASAASTWSKTFSIWNDGTQSLSLTTPFASTPHFSVGQPGRNTLTPGENTTFTVTLRRGATWTGSEQISFASTDADNGDGVESPFTFLVSGSVVNPQDTIGLFAPKTATTYLRNSNDSGYADLMFAYGPPNGGWQPIVGDWNGDGIRTIGLYNPASSVFYLRNANNTGYADLAIQFGPANGGWLPVVGDWNRDGIDTIGIYDPKASVFHLRNCNSTGPADLIFAYGPVNAGWKPIVGDFNGDGACTVGLYNAAPSSFYLRNTNTSGYADISFPYGPASSGWKPIVGDWNADGKDTVGLYNPAASTFYLRNTNNAGYANLAVAYGPANSGWTPIVGNWIGSKALVAAGGASARTSTAPTLTQLALHSIVNQAIARWSDAGLSSAIISKLAQVQVTASDLPDSFLAETVANRVYIDSDAAGYGWFVDHTPNFDEEFALSPPARQLQAIDPRAVDRIDLLTVVEHELGHVAGLDDLDDALNDLMSGKLGHGIRRLP